MCVVIKEGKASGILKHLVDCLPSSKRVTGIPPGWIVWVEVNFPAVGEDDRSVYSTQLGVEVGCPEGVRSDLVRRRLVASWGDNDILEGEVAPPEYVDWLPGNGGFSEHHLLVTLVSPLFRDVTHDPRLAFPYEPPIVMDHD